MSSSRLASGLIGGALLLLVFSLSSAYCLAQNRGGGTRADIAELLKKHDDAMNQHDLEGILALYAPGANTLVLGTGPGERYQGVSEIRTAYTEFFKDFDKGTLTHECYWKSASGAGTVGWGAAMCKFTDSRGDKRREYELNISAVVEKLGGKWQFRMLHFSNLTSGATGSQ